MLKNILIIANPGSGKGNAPEHAQTLSEQLKEAYNCDIDIRETTQVGDAEEWAKSAKQENYDTVICLGGDGTVNEVINGLMAVKNSPVFSFVPIGTANDLGRVLGFEMTPELALEQFKNLEEDTIDVGEVNGKFFMDVVAIGDIPKSVVETDSEQKNQLGYLAYVVDGVKAILDTEEKEYEVTNSSGETFRLKSKAIIVALTSSLGGVENLIEHRKYNDGFLQFAALKENVLASGVETLANEGGIPNGHVDNDTLLAFSDDYISIRLMEEIEEEWFSNVDGDEGPELPLEIKVHKQALKVLRPKMKKS